MTLVVRSGTWLLVLLLALLGLHDLDLTPTRNVALSGPDAAAGMVMAVARLVALALGWYLVAATILTLLAGAAGAARTTARWLVPRTVREALRHVCGLTIVLTAAVPTLAAGADERSPITMQRLADEPEARDAPAIAMHRLDPRPTAASPSPSDPAPYAVTPARASHVIGRGEHLWAVAESTLRSAWGAAPTDDEVDPYWRELIRQNRSGLPDPTNPDLVHPGHEIELPPVPARDV